MPTSSADHDHPSTHLEIAGLSAGYGQAPVIREIDLSVGREEVVSVVGPNGAGKSTLLKTILGMLAPMEGTIRLEGADIGGLRTDQIARRGVGYVPQVKDVFDPLTVRENLEMGGYVLGRRAAGERLEEVFELYPTLAAMRDRYGGHLSGGERKLLAMARVLMTRPTVLVLDEPTAGLSPQLAHQLLHEQVGRLAATGVAVLLVEQHARDALTISDRAYVLAAGQVVLVDRAATLLERPDIHEIFLGRTVAAVE
jgi:ABC-type branched-subunit amino acid transport system ATPase component